MYREAAIRDNEVVQGVLRPDLHPEDPRIREAVIEWGGTHFLHQTAYGVELTLIRRRTARRAERWWLHGALALATLLTTTIAGAYFAGFDPVRYRFLALGAWFLPVPVELFPGDLVPGLAFSVPLLLILLGHEMGHYLTARRHAMDVSPPYFIPSPSWVNPIGTFGAFIKLRSPILNRAILLDVGAAGPLASFVLSSVALAVGLALSRPASADEVPALARYAVLYGAQPLWFGDSLMMRLLAALFAPAGDLLLLHPVALAGWLGLFVTALNLLPLSQLDGGHILYALVGRWQRPVGYLFLGLLLLLGYWWVGWWVWAVAILVLGRGRIQHPSVYDPSLEVSGRRSWVGWACVAIFLLTFVPIPIQW